MTIHPLPSISTFGDFASKALLFPEGFVTHDVFLQNVSHEKGSHFS
jgi:hypothetical protein